MNDLSGLRKGIERKAWRVEALHFDMVLFISLSLLIDVTSRVLRPRESSFSLPLAMIWFGLFCNEMYRSMVDAAASLQVTSLLSEVKELAASNKPAIKRQEKPKKEKSRVPRVTLKSVGENTISGYDLEQAKKIPLYGSFKAFLLESHCMTEMLRLESSSRLEALRENVFLCVQGILAAEKERLGVFEAAKLKASEEYYQRHTELGSKVGLERLRQQCGEEMALFVVGIRAVLLSWYASKLDSARKKNKEKKVGVSRSNYQGLYNVESVGFKADLLAIIKDEGTLVPAPFDRELCEDKLAGDLFGCLLSCLRTDPEGAVKFDYKKNIFDLSLSQVGQSDQLRALFLGGKKDKKADLSMDEDTLLDVFPNADGDWALSSHYVDNDSFVEYIPHVMMTIFVLARLFSCWIRGGGNEDLLNWSFDTIAAFSAVGISLLQASTERAVIHRAYDDLIQAKVTILAESSSMPKQKEEPAAVL